MQVLYLRAIVIRCLMQKHEFTGKRKWVKRFYGSRQPAFVRQNFVNSIFSDPIEYLTGYYLIRQPEHLARLSLSRHIPVVESSLQNH